MLLNIEKVSHSHLVQCCDSCRSLYNKGLEQEEKMALLRLGKNTKTTMPLLGGRLDKFINQSFLFPKHFHLSPCTQERGVSSAQTMTAQRTSLSCGHVPLCFLFILQDFKEAHNKCGEMLRQALNVIIQGSKNRNAREWRVIHQEKVKQQLQIANTGSMSILMWFKREKY